MEELRMKSITLKIGKKSQTIKPKNMDDITRLTYTIQGEILKSETLEDLSERFTCKVDDKKVQPKELLLKLKDILKGEKDGETNKIEDRIKSEIKKFVKSKNSKKWYKKFNDEIKLEKIIINKNSIDFDKLAFIKKEFFYQIQYLVNLYESGCEYLIANVYDYDTESYKWIYTHIECSSKYDISDILAIFMYKIFDITDYI